MTIYRQKFVVSKIENIPIFIYQYVLKRIYDIVGILCIDKMVEDDKYDSNLTLRSYKVVYLCNSHLQFNQLYIYISTWYKRCNISSIINHYVAFVYEFRRPSYDERDVVRYTISLRPRNFQWGVSPLRNKLFLAYIYVVREFMIIVLMWKDVVITPKSIVDKL